MDKLKIIKISVFFMTFVLVFLLCFAVTRVISQIKGEQEFEVHLPEKDILGMSSSGDYLYVQGKQAIYVVDIKERAISGKISLNKEVANGI